MSIVLQSTGGGSVTINEPSTASNFTQTLPASTGTVMVSGNMPAFSAYGSVSQSVSSGTVTKVVLQTEEFDTASCFDNSTNYRFTPNVAGYYQINGQIVSGGSVITRILVGIYKNGVINKWGVDLASGGRANVSSIIYLNGTTDYVELYGLVSATSPTFAGSATQDDYFNGCLVRVA